MIRKYAATGVLCLMAHGTLADMSLLGDLAAAKSYDYCTWAYKNAADLSLLPDVSVYVSGQTPVPNIQSLPSAVVIDAGIRVASASSGMGDCEETFAAGQKLVSEIRRINARGMRKQAKFKKAKDPEIARIQADITALWLEDQLARVSYSQTQSESKTDSRHWAHRLATADAVVIDEKSARYLKDLLDGYDWVDIPRFSRPISQHAWILVQHSDDDVDLQRLALSRMEPYLNSGGVLKRNYAYLWDRVAVNSGALQRYGTQPDWASCSNGMLALMPIEDPENVDLRRGEMQMGPAQNDLQKMSAQACVSRSK